MNVFTKNITPFSSTYIATTVLFYIMIYPFIRALSWNNIVKEVGSLVWCLHQCCWGDRVCIGLFWDGYWCCYGRYICIVVHEDSCLGGYELCVAVYVDMNFLFVFCFLCFKKWGAHVWKVTNIHKNARLIFLGCTVRVWG